MVDTFAVVGALVVSTNTGREAAAHDFTGARPPPLVHALARLLHGRAFRDETAARPIVAIAVGLAMRVIVNVRIGMRTGIVVPHLSRTPVGYAVVSIVAV